jgi:hypothetical protein
MEYPIIDFLDKTNGISIRKQIRKVTKHLGFGYANHKYDRRIKIYSIFGHREAIPHAMGDIKSAIDFCLYLEQTYGDYWDIQDNPDWKEADIVQIAQYSVGEGVKTYYALQSLEEKETITFEDLKKALAEQE